MGIFRFTRAEFTKIFKKPSAYIMAGFLVVVALFGYFIYKPQVSPTYLANIEYKDTDTVGGLYERYLDGTLSQSDSNVRYEQNFTQANQILLNYSHDTERVKTLTADAAVVNSKFLTLLGVSGLETTPTDAMNAAIREMSDVLNTLEDDIARMQSSYGTTLYGVSEYVNSTTYSDGMKNINDLKQVLQSGGNVASTINLNSYMEKLNEFVSQSIYYLNSTIEYYQKNITSAANDYTSTYSTVPIDQHQSYRKTLISQLIAYNNYVTNLLDNQSKGYAIVVITADAKKKYSDQYEYLSTQLQMSRADDVITGSSYDNINNILKDSSNLENLFDSTKNIRTLSLSPDIVDELNKFYTEVVLPQKDAINTEIDEYASTNSTSNTTEDKDGFIRVISKQKSLSENTQTLFASIVNDNILKDMSTDEIHALYGFNFNTYNTYSANYRYMIENELYNFEVGEPFDLTHTSTGKISAYDFTYFIVSVSMIAITLFAIFMITNLISTENDNGTIKMLLTRPYQRYKIITGKMFATLLFAVIFLLFVAIVSLCAGWGLYGINMTSVVTVFNGTTAMSINPILLLLIFLLCCVLKISFYIILAAMISILFKTFPASIIVNLIVYIGIIVMDIFLGGFGWYAYLPFADLMLFSYFGSHSIGSTNGMLSSLLSSPFQGQVPMIASILITCAFAVFMLAITYHTFNKRDY